MTAKKNGFVVRDPAVGNMPSTYWRGDLWECPGCQTQIAEGFGRPMTKYDDEDGPAFEFHYV